jgi:hypothetical protein
LIPKPKSVHRNGATPLSLDIYGFDDKDAGSERELEEAAETDIHAWESDVEDERETAIDLAIFARIIRSRKAIQELGRKTVG